MKSCRFPLPAVVFGRSALLLAFALSVASVRAQTWLMAASPAQWRYSYPTSFRQYVAADATGTTLVTGGFSGEMVFGTDTLATGRSQNQGIFVARLSAAG